MNKRTHSIYWCVIAIVMTLALGIMGCSDDEPGTKPDTENVPMDEDVLDDPDMALKKAFWKYYKSIGWIDVEKFQDNNGVIGKTFASYSFEYRSSKLNKDSVICVLTVTVGRRMEKGCRLFEDFRIVTINDKNNPDWEKIKLVHVPTNTEVTMLDFSQWEVGAEVTFQGFKVNETGIEPFTWTEKFVSEYTINIFSKPWSKPIQDPTIFLNEDGEERMMYFGPLHSKYGCIPIVFDDEEQPDERTILYMYVDSGYNIRYLNPDYKELVTGMSYVYSGIDCRKVMPHPILDYLYELYGFF